VIKLQKLLNAKLPPGSPRLPENGHFLQMTREAVLAFQTAAGLTADGVVGVKTWKALGLEEGAALASADPPWLEIARGEIGVAESPGTQQNNPRIVRYLRTTTNISRAAQEEDETPWCSAFVNWCLGQAGIAGTNHALAKSWLTWGYWLPVPVPGAITVIRNSSGTTDPATGSSTGFHVGFYLRGEDHWIRLLGGNQGNRVKESSFHLGSYMVQGCRWPYPVGDMEPPSRNVLLA
jgi:uncharacterized protein (TIGR02594 family)